MMSARTSFLVWWGLPILCAGLGAMAAAQLMRAARAAEPGLEDALMAGDLSPLLGWLRREVHAHGSRLGFQDLLRSATGKPLDPADFTAHLAARYLDGG